VTEKELAGAVRELAELFGWLRYHTWRSVHSPAGFPDEILLRDSRLVVAELKSERGKLGPAQELWLEAFRAIPSAEVYVWKPTDLEQVGRVLSRREART